MEVDTEGEGEGDGDEDEGVVSAVVVAETDSDAVFVGKGDIERDEYDENVASESDANKRSTIERRSFI